MSIQIEVQDIHAKLLIDFYVQRLKVLRDEILEREREIKEINGIIQKLKKGDSNVEISTSTPSASLLPYSEKWPWVKKIRFAIESQNHPLTTKEIVEVLTEYEAAFIFERKRAVASISSILSMKSGPDKDFLRVQSESGDFAYTINKISDNDIDDEPF